MTLGDQFATDVANVFINTDEFAETITYTPTGEAGVSVTAVVERLEGQSQDYVDGDAATYQAMVHVSVASVASPAVGDTVTFDGLDWAVVGMLPGDAGLHTLRVERSAPKERAGQGHRLRR